jgi:hypothetical protein
MCAAANVIAWRRSIAVAHEISLKGKKFEGIPALSHLNEEAMSGFRDQFFRNGNVLLSVSSN